MQTLSNIDDNTDDETCLGNLRFHVPIATITRQMLATARSNDSRA
jgi:hypothetical protein